MNLIDLRSDTVTQPTDEMRKAMSLAEVGDDVFGEDRTVNRLQELAAEVTGKEAALFVPSGTMGNLAAVLSHCERGDEAIMGHLGHTFLFEGGGISALGGVVIHTIPNQVDGSLREEDIQNAIRPEDVHHPRTKLIILENTHNRCGGVVLAPLQMKQVKKVANEHSLKIHLDGARIFNAAAELDTPVSNLTRAADSITFCLSKGLCAPVGSVLCGSKDFIAESLRIRKQLGGGMRQAGILAAAGIIAVEVMSKRLKEDHIRAHRLADGLAAINGLILTLGHPQTNMVFVSLDDDAPLSTSQVVEELKKNGILIGVVGHRKFRLVTHYWIDDLAINRTIATFSKLLHSS